MKNKRLSFDVTGVKVYDACDRSDIASMSVASMLPYFRFSNISTPKQVAGKAHFFSSHFTKFCR